MTPYLSPLAVPLLVLGLGMPVRVPDTFAAAPPGPSALPRAGGSDASTSATWTWPLSPRPVVVRRFAPPAHDWLPGHRGVDLAGREGQPVLAAGDGVVGFSGVIGGAPVVTVLHAGGLRTTYQPVTDRLARGTAVRRGDPLGRLGTTGSHCSAQACLHWGLLRGRAYLDPLLLLGLAHPVLLPLQR